MQLTTVTLNCTFHFYRMHEHIKVIHKKIVLTNIWGATGFRASKLIHVSKESSASALKTEEKKPLMLQVWKFLCTYGSDFYYFLTCA